jgi:hypothetical protein
LHDFADRDLLQHIDLARFLPGKVESPCREVRQGNQLRFCALTNVNTFFNRNPGNLPQQVIGHNMFTFDRLKAGQKSVATQHESGRIK